MNRPNAINIIVIFLLGGHLILCFIGMGGMVGGQSKSLIYQKIDEHQDINKLKNYARIKIGSLVSSYNGCRSGLHMSMVLSALSIMLLSYNMIYLRKRNLREKRDK